MRKLILPMILLVALTMPAMAQVHDTIDIWLKGWNESVVVDMKQTHPEYQNSQTFGEMFIEVSWQDSLTVTGFEEYDFYEVLETNFIMTGDNSAILQVAVEEESQCVYSYGVGDTVRFLGHFETEGEGWFSMDDAQVIYCNEDVTGDLTRRPVVDLPTLSKVWFKPNADKTEWEVYGSHESIACCYEFYVAPEEAWKVIEFDQVFPYDFFEGWGMNWRLFDNPNYTSYGYGSGFGSAQLGGMLETYDGLLGTIYASEPMEMTIQATPDSNYPPAFWFDGEVPNWRMPTIWWIEDYEAPSFQRNKAMCLGEMYE